MATLGAPDGSLGGRTDKERPEPGFGVAGTVVSLASQALDLGSCGRAGRSGLSLRKH